MLDITGHLAALLHLQRAGRELVGADHLRRIEGDAGLGFTSTTGTLTATESDAVTSAVLMPVTVSAPVSGS